VNKYLHTVASVGFLFTLNYDARNHELKNNVEFYSKNKFEKSVHLVGFIITIYHDTRSPERQIPFFLLLLFLSRLYYQ